MAVQYLLAAEEEGQLSVNGMIVLGKAYYKLGEVASAEATWLLVRDADLEPKTLIEVNYQLLDLYQESGNVSAAINTLRLIAELEPLNAEVRYQLGLMMAAQEPETALGYLIHAVELDPGLADAVEILQRNLEQNDAINDPAFNDLNRH